MAMQPRETVVLQRDCKALFVPIGIQVNAKKGTEVTIMQQLGGSFTVLLEGQMARIDAADADALGKERPVLPGERYRGPVDREAVERLAWEHMRTCYDPEIPVDIVELGLVYGCEVHETKPGKFRVDVRMTLTAPGCGMGDVIAQDVKDKLLVIPGVREADVEVVLEPPWTAEMMSEAARLQTGMV
jgi:probable FeS assembly SUF system protein SufT